MGLDILGLVVFYGCMGLGLFLLIARLVVF